jgi:hypothetical protein
MPRRLVVARPTLIAVLVLASLATTEGRSARARPQTGAAPQSQATRSRPPVSPSPGKKWTVPRTSWGDPDLHGTFTNGDAYATPLERPDQFAGRRVEDITGAELAEVRRAQLQGVIDALPGGRVRGPDGWWVQNLNFGKGGQPWMVVDPPDGKIPALTAEAQQRARTAGRVRSSFAGGPFDGPEDLGLLDRCISRSVPGSMIPVMYGNNYQIVQTPGFVVITYEIIHEARIIPLDGRPHLGQAIRQHMGDARGRWEGDTLVVETTNFTRAAAYRGANPATLRVVERFTRVSPDAIKWTATIEDPSTWTRPWTVGLPLFADPQGVMAFECHEGNYGMRNILSAERAGDNGRSPTPPR